MERKDWNYKTYLGDCIDGMRLLPAGSVDFLFTDLPYGRTNCKWDTPIDLEAFWSEADRVVKKNGAVALFAQTPFDKVLGCSNLRNLRYEWIWEKSNATGHLNAKRMPMRAHENILIFYRRQPTYNPQKTDGHQPVNSYTHYIDTQNRTEIYQKATKEVKGGGNTDRYPRSVVKGPSDKQTSHLHPTQKPVWLCERLVLTYTNPGGIHPTQKPVELCEYLIRTYTRSGELVADICVGSGTTAIAAINTERRFVCFETAPSFYAAASERIRAAQAVKSSGEKGV